MKFSLLRIWIGFLPAIIFAFTGACFMETGLAQDQKQAVRLTPDDAPVKVKEAPDLDLAPPTNYVEEGASMLEVYAQDSVRFDADTRKAVFKGEVKALHPTFQMRTDTLTVTVKEGGGGIESAEANGSVLFVYQDPEQIDPDTGDPMKSMGKAGRAVLNMDTGKVRLSGYPQLQQGGNLIVGTSSSTTITLSRDGKHEINGPSKIQYLDKDKAISAQP